MSIRVLVVDDHQVVREGFCALLENQEDMQVVGQAGEGRNGHPTQPRSAPACRFNGYLHARYERYRGSPADSLGISRYKDSLSCPFIPPKNMWKRR